jgi:hypothetical protein
LEGSEKDEGGKMTSELARVWFEEAKRLEVGQAIFVRVGDKKEQTALARDFEEERKKFEKLDLVLARQLFINKVLKERKQYVVIERKYRALFTAFLRNEDGRFTKLTIDPERRRILTLMVQDRKSREEIEEVLNGLTDAEIAEFFPEI